MRVIRQISVPGNEKTLYYLAIAAGEAFPYPSDMSSGSKCEVIDKTNQKVDVYKYIEPTGTATQGDWVKVPTTGGGGTGSAQWGQITGTITDQTDLQNALDEKQDELTTAQLAAANSAVTAAKVTSYDNHLASTANPHSVTKAQVGLGNCDNTADADKPVSTATQNALDAKVDAVTGKGLSTNDYVATDHYTNAEIDNKISTEAATFRGSFETKAALDAYTGDKDNNDYAVVVADETKSNECWRYKYNGTAWVAEYRINETPMTTEQLAALNSGITAAKVAAYEAYATTKANVADVYNKTEMNTQLAAKEDASNKVTAISSSSTDDEYPSAKCMYDIIGNVEALLAAINTGAGV